MSPCEQMPHELKNKGAIMKTDCVIAVFDSVTHAERAIHILDLAGFTPDSVSLVTRHVDANSEMGQELQLGDDSIRDAAIGATLGGLVGILGEAGVFMATGMVAFIAAGPLVALAGAVFGGLLGAMRGWGIHESHIQRYEDLLHAGRVLVVVQGDPARMREAEVLLHETDASEVQLHAPTSEDAPEVAET